MANFYGDFRAGRTVRIRFNTTSFTTGAPTTLSAGAVIVSKDGTDVTPSGGMTLTVDVGSVTGRHHVVIDTSVDPTTFTAGSEYAVRLSGTANVGGTSVVGIVVGEFAIANRAVAVDASGRVTLAAATHTGAVVPTVTTVTSDVGITQAGADKAWTTTTRTITGGTIGTYTGNTPQTGDAYARIGASGAGLTALGDGRLANLDAMVSSRLADTDYLDPPTAAEIDTVLSGTHGSGLWDAAGLTTADVQAALDTQGYTTARADNLDNLDAPVSDPVTVADRSGFSLAATGLDAIPITPPSGPATTFRQMVVMVYRRFFLRVTRSATEITTYADNGTTPITTQPISAAGTDEEQGAAS